MSRSSPAPGLYSTSVTRGSSCRSLARSMERSISASVVMTLCFAMNSLPQGYQLLKVLGRRVQDLLYVRPLGIRGPNRIFPVCQGDVPIRSKVHDHLCLA